jgi:hypothetical protein
MKRFVQALVLAVFLVALTVAGASGAGLDRSFGHGGRVKLNVPLPPGVSKFEAIERTTGPGNATYVLALTPLCDPACGDQQQLLYRFEPDGKLDRGFGGSGHAVHLQRLPRWGYELVVDQQGRPVLLSGDNGTQLTRYTKTGHLDQTFGQDGTVDLTRFTEGPPGIAVVPGGKGGFLIYAEGEEGRGFMPFDLEEITADGAPVARFGHDGLARVDVAGAFPIDPVPTADGGVLVGAYYFNNVVTLTRVSNRGRLDTRFDETARRSLRVLRAMHLQRRFGELEPTAVLPVVGGGIEVLGTDYPIGFEVRLRGDGRGFPGVGRHGATIFPRPVDEAMPLAGGAVLGADEMGKRAGAFVLRGDGTLDRSFHFARLPEASSPYGLSPAGSGLANFGYTQKLACKGCVGRYVARLTLPTGEGPVL